MDIKENEQEVEGVKPVTLQVKKPIYYKIQFTLVIIFSFVIWILVYLISEKIYIRKDLSSKGISSLSPGTKQLLKKLADYLDITLALSISKLPEQAEFFKRRVLDLIEEFKLTGGSFVRTQVVDPDDPKYAKEAEAIKKRVERVGMQKVGEGEISIKEIYSAILLSYQDKSDILYIDGQNLDRLEYEIAFRIQKFLKGSKKSRIGYIEGHNERDLFKDYSNIRKAMEESFEVLTFNFQEEKKYMLEGYDIVIIMGPIKDFSYKELLAIDQYIINGGNLIIMYDGIDIPERHFIGVPIKNEKFQEFLEHLGIRINNDLAFDVSCEWVNTRKEQKGIEIYFPVRYGLWVRIDRSNFNQNLLFTKDIPSVFWPWGSTIEIVNEKQPDVKKEVIFTTTEYGLDIKDETNIDPAKYQDYFKKDEETYKKLYKPGKKLLGAYFSGKFKSFFAQKKNLPADVISLIENYKGGFKQEGDREAKVIIFGNSKFLNNQFIREDTSPENLIFFLNLLDWLVQSEELLSVRSKGAGISLIKQNLTYSEKLRLTIIGSTTVPLIFLLIGFTIFLTRKLSKKLIYD
ncbi:MAG: GldG family protein [Planctomycetota bacterium]